jgi:hypothetical protein
VERRELALKRGILSMSAIFTESFLCRVA